MAEIRVNATGGLKLFDADDSHYAQIIAGTITSNVDVLTLGHASADFNIPVKVLGTTPTLTIGDAGAEDTKIVFDGNAQDFYIALDDSADDLLIGLGSAVGTTPAISIDENLAISTYGDITMTGATPTLTIGDAGAEDAKIVFDGNAQDFHIGLDDSADDLVIGLGSTLGTTSHIVIDETGAVTMPLQPAVIATYNGSDIANVMGNNTFYSLIFDTEVTDKNADFDVTNDSTPTGAANNCSFFTAPVTGTYLITANVRLVGFTDNHTIVRLDIKTSNGTFEFNSGKGITPNIDQDGRMVLRGAVIADMDASDIAFFSIYGYTTDETIDIDGDGGTNRMVACGIHLLS